MKIGVVGAGGRMGAAVIRQAILTDGCCVNSACDQRGSSVIGRDVGDVIGVEKLGIIISDNPIEIFESADAVIEFSSPDATVQNAKLATNFGCIHVIGTTGLTVDQETLLKNASEFIPVVYAPNMSEAVNILFYLTKQVAATLNEDFDIEIIEMHHRNKVDAPSGTALGLGRAAAAGMNIDFKKRAVLSREGQTGIRKMGDIGFSTLRGGDVTGDHKVIFAADGERLELGHKASSRKIFARGAVRSALWAQDKKPGFYTMSDVLELPAF